VRTKDLDLGLRASILARLVNKLEAPDVVAIL
jgi:hypothetical protein